MRNIDKQALREEFKFMQDHYSDPADRDRQVIYIAAEALLNELEAAEHQLYMAELAKHNLRASRKAQFKRRRLAEKRIAELEAELSALRPVGVMSEAAFHRLEDSESRFIALWPRPGIPLPRKRPDDGVLVYAKVGG